MRTQVVAGVGAGTVQAPTRPYLGSRRARPPGALVGSLGKRLLRIIGRAVLGLPPSTWLLLDVFLLAVAVYVAYLTFPPPAELATPHVALWQASAVLAFAVISASLVFGLYERETFMSRSRTFTRMLLTTVTATVIAYAIIYVIMYSTVSRRVSGLAMSLFFMGGVGIRLGA